MLGIWDWWSKPVCVCKRKMSGVGHFGSKYRLQISRISISREKREILSHFSARSEKKPIKILLHKMDIIVVWIWQRLQWSYFLLEKLKPSLFYYIFTCLIYKWICWRCFCTLTNHQKRKKFGEILVKIEESQFLISRLLFLAEKREIEKKRETRNFSSRGNHNCW